MFLSQGILVDIMEGFEGIRVYFGRDEMWLQFELC